MKNFILLAALFFPSMAFAAPGDNFRPCPTVALSATTSTSSAALSACGTATLNVDCYNSGSVTVFIGGGNGSATASVPTSTPSYSSYHLGAGMDKVFDLGDSNFIAAITSTGSATVYCTSGSGQ